MRLIHSLATGALLALATVPALAETPTYKITLKDHVFAPQELTIPAGQKIKLVIANQDAAAAEFESYELNREKIIPAQSEGFVFIGPLDAGTYPVFDDFHRDSTKATLIVK